MSKKQNGVRIVISILAIVFGVTVSILARNTLWTLGVGLTVLDYGLLMLMITLVKRWQTR